jgi:hypothetical protein
MGAKKQEKKRLIRKRREMTNPHGIGSVFPILTLWGEIMQGMAAGGTS